MRKPLCTPLLASLLLALAGVGAHAQAVYRIVGPDGKVTFSDRAPDTAAKPAQSTTSGTGATGAALPYELQQVATRFPVTLYTGTDCTPCNNARNLLVGRGIPFTERTITTTPPGFVAATSWSSTLLTLVHSKATSTPLSAAILA